MKIIVGSSHQGKIVKKIEIHYCNIDAEQTFNGWIDCGSSTYWIRETKGINPEAIAEIEDMSYELI
jgi:hypothetical protein